MKPNRSLRSFLALAGSSLLVVSSVNATQFWDGTGSGANWNTAANWGGDTLPAFGTTAINFGSLSTVAGTAFGNVVVPTQTTANNDLTAGTVIKGINFGNNGAANRTAAYTLTGNSIILGTGTNDGITATAITAGGAAIQDIVSFDIDLGTVVGAQNRVLNAGLNHNLRVDGVISGADTDIALFASGVGTVTLKNTASSYVGLTSVANGGVLEVESMANGGANSSIGASSSANNNLRFNNGSNSPLKTTLRHIGSVDSSTDRGFAIFGNVPTGTNSAIESSGAGTLSFTSSAAITYGTGNQTRNFYLGGTNTGNNVFNLAFGNNGTGVNTFTKEGVGKWILSGTNTYTGATTISDGTLQFAKQVSLYNNTPASWTAANIKVAGTGTLALNVGGTGEFTTGNVTTLLTNLGGANGTSTTGFAAGSKVGFDTTNASGGSFTVGDVIADSTGAGGGGIGLTKLGTNTLVLSNANTYTGATSVNGGTLLINGSTSSTSLVTVNTTATLGGTGSIGGAVTVKSGGTLAPGASIESLASGALTMESGSTFSYEVLDNTAVGADLLGVNGALSLTSVSLDLSLANAALAGGGWIDGDKITLISYFDAGSGITSGFTGYADDTDYIFGANTWTFDYNDLVAGDNFAADAIANGQNRFVTMTYTVIPEPSVALLSALGMLALLRRRRA